MRIASHGERDALFCIDDLLLQRLRELSKDNASTEEMTMLLRQAGVPKPAASLALMRAGIVNSLIPARAAVDQSLAYADWPGPLSPLRHNAIPEPAVRVA